MQADRSHYGVNDGNSGLFCLSYSDSLERMVGFPSALGEAIISGQSSCRVADDYWSTQSGKHTLTDFSIGSSYHQISSIHDVHKSGSPIGKYPALERLDSSAPFPVITSNSSIVNSSAFERTNYSFDGSLPFVGRAEVVPVGNSSLNEWILRGEDVNSSNPGLGAGPSRFSRELSLSLATSQPSGVHGASINQEQCSEMSSSPKRRVGSDNTSCSSNSLSYSYKQTLQVSPVLSGSRFFHAMQEILAEVACYALENLDQMSFSASGIDHDASFSSRISSPNVLHSIHRSMFPNKRDVESKKKHLLSLLQVVDDQYNQCLDEIHTVISAFHAVTEMDPNLHARFALPTISLMYRSLRERISSCILAMGEKFSGGDARDDCSFETSFIKKQWPIQQLSKSDHQLWRPQRGLPERSVSVLKAWMFQNFLHPYPKDAEKHLLAMKSGLTRSQVSNWFINARVRLWKPMIEEMYAEMNRRKTQRNEEVTNGNLRNQMRFDNIRFTMD